MKSQTLQELVKKIYSDEKTQQEFQNNPESVLSRFSLTKQEKNAVLKTHAKMGLVATNSQHLEATLRANEGWLSPIP